MKKTNDFSFGDAEVQPIQKGYYCEWGVYHLETDHCRHHAYTGVPPHYMQRMKREMFPNWQDGLQGRPERHIKTNAMTQAMQNAIVLKYQEEHILD